ncbi:MAG: RNA polymerase sigma factor, partial [Terriglobales bacterium]
MSAPTEQLADVVAGENLRIYVPALRRFFSKRAASREVDDLVQEVFVRLQAHRNGPPIEHLDRYLFTVARNVLTDQSRRRAARREAAHEPLEESHHPTEELTP